MGWTTSAYSMTGTFTLTHNGQTTSAIAWNADAATIKTAVEALSTVGARNVAVTVTIPGGNAYSRTFGLTFQNGKGATNVPQTTITTSSLNGIPFGAPTGFANTTVTGGTYTESQTIALSNASGGTWRVAYNGEVSAPLAPTITAALLKSTLDAFVGIDNVTVTGGSGSFTVTFGGTQSTTNMQQIFGDAANASNGSTVRTITTAYDAADQITSVSDPSSTINYTLDNLGRATTIAQSVNGLTPTVTLNQVFDAMNNRTELKATIASTLDFKNTYQYDKLQRLTDIVQQGQSGGNTVIAKHITQSFNALSQRTQIARYQSTGTTNAVATTDFTFDTANRLSGIAHKQGATNLNTYAYTYDPLSRIATIVSTLEGTDTYSYDQTSQLVGATHTSHANETYGFDANGNRNTSGFTTGTNNQTTAGLGFTYTYDDEGNRTSKTETSTGKVEEYTWDHRNRLTKVVFRNTSGGAIVKQVDYEYDAYNRLVRRTFDADGAGAGAATNQYWVYDEGINAVLQFDGSSASNLSHRYLWSDNVDELLADEQIAGNNTLWGLADHLGSLRDIADYSESTGVTTIANHRTINSFGKLVSETNAAVDMLFAFTGKQFDEATGLQHNLFRWLDPSLGQWLNEDPLSFGGGDENVRRYVGNGVVDSIDPAGLEDAPTTNYSTMYLNESFRAGVPLSAYGNQPNFGSIAWNYTGHFFDAWGDYITWWNGTPSTVDTIDNVLSVGTVTAQSTAVVAASLAILVQGSFMAATYLGYETTTFSIFPMTSLTNNTHFVYQVGIQGMHATGIRGALRTEAIEMDTFITMGLARWTFLGGTRWTTFTSTVINSQAATATGVPASSCLGAAVMAFLRGNGLWR